MDINCNWPFPPPDLCLSGDDVHIWCASLNPPDSSIVQMAQTLSADELKQAERFHFMQHRKEFIAAHGLVRKLLADYLNIEAKRVTFEYGRNGKPFLPEKFNKEEIRFNLSHSNGFALFKEAYLKATGEGFSSALDTIGISSCTKDEFVSGHTRSKFEDINHWTFLDLKPLPGFAAACAVEEDEAVLQCWRIPNSIFQSFDENG